MNSLLRDTVEATVIAVIEDLIQDWGLELDGGVGADTQLVAHLEFASVDIIQLCVALEQAYGRKLGFQNLLMRDGSYVGDLSVRQIAQFIEQRLKPQEGASA
jgi:acyl carrier protein